VIAVAASELVFPVRRLAPGGLEAWAQVIERGYAGYVAKDEASVYEAGATRRWLKVKVPGWTDSENRWRPESDRPADAEAGERSRLDGGPADLR
jgi:hypothetical protein